MNKSKNKITNKPGKLEKGLKPMFSNTSMPPVKSPKKNKETVVNEVSEANEQQDNGNVITSDSVHTGANHDKSK